MLRKTVEVINEQGMHMRPAGMIAKTAKTAKDHHGCEITLTANGKTVKATSPMHIMSACVKKGCKVEIACDGGNEQAALDEIAALFECGFGE